MVTVPPKGKPYPSFPLFPHASGQWADLSGRAVAYGRWLAGLDTSSAVSHAGNVDELSDPVGRMG
jgi:hypothetical protein